MIWVGIDYSLISPAITTFDDNKFSFHSIQREKNIKDSYKMILESCGISVDILPKLERDEDETKMEISYSYDADLQAQKTAEKIKEALNGEKNFMIGLEGLSFSSSGASALTYAGYHFILRRELANVLDVPYEKIVIVAPSRVKKTAGKGNYNKEQMIDAFRCDDFFSSSSFWMTIKEKPELFQSPKAKNWMKPLDDLVDSAYACKYMWQNFQENQEL